MRARDPPPPEAWLRPLPALAGRFAVRGYYGTLRQKQKRNRERLRLRMLSAQEAELTVQHENRVRALGARHTQEQMLLERKIARAEDELKEAHEAQLQRLTQELMARATQSEKATVRNRDADAGEGAGGEGTVASERAYLMKGNRFDLRVRHTDPEVVRKLKLAKHLRRKKRMAEADEMQLEARTKNYEITRSWYGEVRRQAQAKSATLVKQQEMAMDTLKTKNTSRLKALQARYERDLANLHRLHDGQLRRARAISKSSNTASAGIVAAPAAAAAADRGGKVSRPQSAARRSTSPKPATLDLSSDARAFTREKPVRPGSAAPRLQKTVEVDKSDWERSMNFLVRLADPDTGFPA